MSVAALLDPVKKMREAEDAFDFGSRLTLMEETSNLPLADVWSEYCNRASKPCGIKLIEGIKKYEAKVLSKRA